MYIHIIYPSERVSVHAFLKINVSSAKLVAIKVKFDQKDID